MSEQIVIALIAAAALVAGAVITTIGNVRSNRAVGRKVDAVTHQVQNSHSTNLRDDIDDLKSTVDEVRRDQRRTHAEVRLIRADVSELRASDTDDAKEHSAIWRALKAITGTTD